MQTSKLKDGFIAVLNGLRIQDLNITDVSISSSLSQQYIYKHTMYFLHMYLMFRPVQFESETILRHFHQYFAVNPCHPRVRMLAIQNLNRRRIMQQTLKHVRYHGLHFAMCTCCFVCNVKAYYYQGKTRPDA